MKNRRLPFGYRMEMGKLTLHTQEAELVRWLFGQYCAGAAYSSLVDKLNHQPVPYDEGKTWNKNMVARMLADQRYIGEKGHPAIISEEVLESAMEIRSAKSTPVVRTETEKVLRQLSGQRRTKRMEMQVLAILNTLIDTPEQIKCPPCSQTIEPALSKELDDALAELPIDEERVNTLVFQAAAAKYRSIGSGEYEAQRLRRIAEQSEKMDTLDADILRSMVEAIEANQGEIISLRLRNGQVITGVNRHENSTAQGYHDPGQA